MWPWSGEVWSATVRFLVLFFVFLPRALSFPLEVVGVDPNLARELTAAVGAALEGVATLLLSSSRRRAMSSPTTVREYLPTENNEKVTFEETTAELEGHYKGNYQGVTSTVKPI